MMAWPAGTSSWLSIPAWFDWRDNRARHHRTLQEVSIPAWFDWRSTPSIRRTARVRRFNPSLVRLARSTRRIAISPNHSFNPSLVRLALTSLSIPKPSKIGFNPSLVRLALLVDPQGRKKYKPFQSQLGSIGACQRRCAVAGRSKFQSQLGSIGALESLQHDALGE